MPSALIVHSRHTRSFARKLAKKYRDVSFMEVRRPPTKDVFKIRNRKDIVIGVGGGSVIDTAKIVAGKRRCIAVPTTASGAALTPYATVWGKEKITVPTAKPVLKNISSIPKRLPAKVLYSTMFDALSHAIESFWSKNATIKSRDYAKKAIYLIRKYLIARNKDNNQLVKAGNLAGQAIAITKTNVVHATSYPLTVKYGVDHGTACGMLLPYFVKYMDYPQLPKLFGLGSTIELFRWLKKIYKFPTISHMNAKLIAEVAASYDRIKDGPRKINKDVLIKILKNQRN